MYVRLKTNLRVKVLLASVRVFSWQKVTLLFRLSRTLMKRGK
jgi:hypothetical protein